MLNIRKSDEYVNASQLCLAVGKQFSNYLKLVGTQQFLETLSKRVGISVEELIQKGSAGKGKDQSTWVHPAVAIHLGQWLGAENAVESIVYLWEQLKDSKLALAATRETSKQLEESLAAKDARIDDLSVQKAQSDEMLLKGDKIRSDTELLAQLKQFSVHWKEEWKAKRCSEWYYQAMHLYADFLVQQMTERGASPSVVQHVFDMLVDFAPRLKNANVIDQRDMDTVFIKEISKIFKESRKSA